MRSLVYSHRTTEQGNYNCFPALINLKQEKSQINILLLLCQAEYKKIVLLQQNRKGLRDFENKLTITKEESWWWAEINLEVEINIYTLLNIK